MAEVTYKNLYTQVNELINKKLQFRGVDRFSEQTASRNAVEPFNLTAGETRDVGAQTAIIAVQTILDEALPSRIISGLTVTASEFPDNQVTVAAGKGTAGGTVYTLDSDTVVPIPFDDETSVYYITMKNDVIHVETTQFANRVQLGKVVVPFPGRTSRVVDKKVQNSVDAYIVQFQEFKFYGDANGQLEEDSQEILKDNIGAIVGETIIGTIKLSDNLRIENTSGSLKLDSQSMQLKDELNNVLAKFDREGVFFFDENGIEMARFTNVDARIGNIKVTQNSLESDNFVSNSKGFQIKDTGDVEFNGLTVRGTIHATGGTIGGFTITPDKLYGGTIQTDVAVGAGDTGVIMDSSGLRGFDAVLGQTFNLPTDGSAPSFASGTISQTIFEINTNAVMRTSSTVGDGTASSAGILINNTGMYGTAANQTLAEANLKALIDGTIRLKGEIESTSGSIGNVTITSTSLSGGLISGSTIQGGTIETSADVPRVRMDDSGIYYQTTTAVGKYGASGSGLSGFQYGDGTKYGAGVNAYIFNVNFPVLAVLAEQNLADIRLYNRSSDPTAGTHELGDLICTAGKLKICETPGTPGTFKAFRKEEPGAVVTTSDLTLTETHWLVVVNTTTGDVTITLPPAPEVPGRQYLVKNIGSANTLTIDASSAETIEDAATKTSTTQYEAFICVSDGTEWWIF